MGQINIKARINSRKVAFCFVYSHFFLSKKDKTNKKTSNPVFFDDKNNENFLLKDLFKENKEEKIENEFFYYDESKFSQNYLEEVGTYIFDNFFSYKKENPSMDMDYFIKITKEVFGYKKEVFDKINKLVSTFGVDRMDVSDQCIFMIAYTEFKIFQTPKNVLLNEMIELAKQYGDDGSSKLINGILHKIISE